MLNSKETRRTFVPVHVTFFLQICSTLKSGHRRSKKLYSDILNNCHLFADGVCANYSREKSENDFSKLTDGHLGSRNPVTEVSDKSGQKGSVKKMAHRLSFLFLSPAPAPPSPQAHLFFVGSLQHFSLVPTF